MQPRIRLDYWGGSTVDPEEEGLGPASTILTIEDYRVAIDAGLQFLKDNRYGYPIGEGQVSDVILTHSHTDHVGGLEPWQRKGVFEKRARILCAPQTQKIVPIVLDQTFNNIGVLYHHVNRVNERLTTIPLGVFELAPGIWAFTGRAGHLNGALYVIIRVPLKSATGKITGYLNICFMGDHAWHDQETVAGSKFPDDIPDEFLPDIIAQIDLTNPKMTIFDYDLEMRRMVDYVINAFENKHKKLIVFLAFANGRTQNGIVGLKRYLKQLGKEGLCSIYCDGSGIELSQIIRDNPWSTEDRDFSLDGVKMIDSTPEARMELMDRDENMAIFTPSGMGDHGPAIPWTRHAVERDDAVISGLGWSTDYSSLSRLERLAKKREEQNQDTFIRLRDDGYEEQWSEYLLRCDVERFHLSGHGGLGDFTQALTKLKKRRATVYGKAHADLKLIGSTHGLQSSKKLCEIPLKEFSEYIVPCNVGTCIPLF